MIMLDILGMIPNLKLFLGIKFFQGFMLTYTSILVALFTKELAHPKNSLKYQIVFYWMIVMGCFLNFFIIDKSRVLYWQFLFNWELTVSIPRLIALLFYFRIQSPHYLLKKNRKMQIKRQFSYFYKDENVKIICEDFFSKIKEEKRLKKEQNVGSWLETAKEYKLQMVLAFAFNALQQLSGINLLLLYSQQIYDIVEVPNIAQANFFFGLVNLLGACFTFVLLAKYTQKVIIILGFFFCCLGILFMIMAFSMETKNLALCLFGSYLYIFSFGFSLGPLIVSYLTYFLPPNLLSYFSSI